MDISAAFLSLPCDACNPGFNFMEYFSVSKLATCISSCAEQCSVMWSVLIKPFLFLRDQHCELASLRHHVETELRALCFLLVSGETWDPKNLLSPVILFRKILKMLEFLFKLNIAGCNYSACNMHSLEEIKGLYLLIQQIPGKWGGWEASLILLLSW